MFDDKICTYAGKNVDDMTLEELRDAVKFLGRAYNGVLEAHRADLEIRDLARNLLSGFSPFEPPHG